MFVPPLHRCYFLTQMVAGEAEAADMLQGAGGHEVLEKQMMSWEEQRWGLGARRGVPLW